MDNMNGAASRSPPDLGAIFDEHFDYVWATLRRLGVRDADREDLVHEVFLKVHGRLADYDDSRPLRPWLFGFAYRVAADHHRLARHRIEVLGAPGDAADDTVAADERVAALEERDLLLSALHTIELDRRAVLVMHDIDDVSVPEIAQMLDIPLNTAYSRLRLARGQLGAAVTRLRIARGAR
ncbi:MAG TPA: RNA polymerase sigma factor [Polyangiaceae bacterium]|jgi:RNA polymerase sigma-70 factor (ECF subfamily)|nr:RNA polymerase sigma factor [Polyangiaceae bacterium]